MTIVDDAVFKAINDPSRRALLDALFEQDGQSLGELTGLLPEMTRYGVMNHLRVLEQAALVTTRRSGRHKLHYLNPVPIRRVHDRWISKYAERIVGEITRIAARTEEGNAMADPVHIYSAYIHAPRERVWKAIVDGDQTVQYFYGTRVESSWEPGAKLVYRYPNGDIAADGEILAVERPGRIEMTFHARWDPELDAEGPAREVWILSEANGMTQLTIELYEVDRDSATHRDFTSGFPYIVSGMKSLIETGAGLPTPY